MILGDVLRAWRSHHELTARESAERIGIPDATLRRVEQGEAMSGDTLALLIRWLLSPGQ